jgi:hypothetical protein
MPNLRSEGRRLHFKRKRKNGQVCQMPKNTGLTFTWKGEDFISKENEVRQMPKAKVSSLKKTKK